MAPKHEHRKEREFRRREADIVGAAIELFTEKDWQTVTIEEIAKRADIGKGTVYKHFSSKDEIYARIVIQDCREYYWKLKKLEEEPDIISRFKKIVKFDWEYYMTSKSNFQRKLANYCEREDFLKVLPETARTELMHVKGAIWQIYQELLEDGVRQGIFPKQSLSYMLHSGVALFEGTYRLIWDRSLDLSELQSQEYLEYLIDFCLRGWGHAK